MSTALLYKPEAAAAALGIGRSKLFELIAAGQLETVRIGRARRIPAEALEEYVARLRRRTGTVALPPSASGGTTSAVTATEARPRMLRQG